MLDIERLATVLHHANSNPPIAAEQREKFYAMKQMILGRYGEMAGYDVQHIVKKCHGCNGTGIYSRYYYEDEDFNSERCYRCNSGVYSEKYIRLERWQVGKRIFHKPLNEVIGPGSTVTIEGLIKHKPSKLAYACVQTLEFVFYSPSWSGYICSFGLPDKLWRKYKTVLAFLLGFDRRKWDVRAPKLNELIDASKQFDVTMVHV